jgi:integrase
VKVSDVQISKGGLWLHETKSGHSRFVHLNPEGLAFFESLVKGRKHEDYALLRADGAQWGDSHQSRRFGMALKKAGLPGHFSFHDLRHSFASMLIQSGVPIEVIADALGHADTRITIRHYAHLSDKVRKEAVARLPSFGLEKSLESNVTNIQSAKKPNH